MTSSHLKSALDISAERMLARMIAGMKGVALVRRRLFRKEPASNVVVAASSLPAAPKPAQEIAFPPASAVLSPPWKTEEPRYGQPGSTSKK